MDWQSLEQHLAVVLNQDFQIDSVQQIGGGDINQAYSISSGRQTYFVKVNQSALVDMFEAEQAGLNEIAATRTIRVPKPISCGQVNHHSFLLMENLNLKRGSSNADAMLGEKLAQLHRVKQPYFGWFRNNTIGSTPQINDPSEFWPDFWCHQRLKFQLKLAADKGYTGRLQKQGELLCGQLGVFFTGYQPQPSLVHGDLWAGNAGVTNANEPVIYDPACYYADREVDIAMTELFGGYSVNFYAAYNDFFPLDAGYQVRKALYNLYHILNHLNLFGSGYLSQAESMMDRLLAEVG